MEDNNIDKFSKKLFENYTLDRLSSDFTEKVMIKIEREKVAAFRAKPLFTKKFLVIFLATFSSIFAVGYFMSGTTEPSERSKKIAENIKLPEYDFGKILEIFNFNLEISLFVKLFVVSIVVLLIIDLLSGSVIDYFLDSKTKKENS